LQCGHCRLRRSHRDWGSCRFSPRQSFFFSRICWGFEGQQAQQHHGESGVLIGRQTQLAPAVQAQAVQQLGFVCRHLASQAGGFHGFRVVCVHGLGHLWHGLVHGHALQHGAHFF
jgi:hypothetical protein